MLFLRGAGGIARTALEKKPRVGVTAPVVTLDIPTAFLPAATAPVAEIPSGFSSASAVVLPDEFMSVHAPYSLALARPHQPRRLLDGWCAARPVLGEHTLPPGGPVCVLPAQIIVSEGTSLSLRTLSSADGPATPVDTLAVISGGGTTRLFFVRGGILTLKDLTLDNGGGTKKGSAIFAAASAKVELLSQVFIQNCVADYGGAFYLKGAGTTLTVAGPDTHVIIQDNVGLGGGGGLFLTDGADVLVNNSALLVLKNNNINMTSSKGGGFYLETGAKLMVSGIGSRATIQGNTAEYGGGFYLTDGAKVFVDGGGMLQIVQNVATTLGGAFCLRGASTTLTLAGADTRVTIQDNVGAAGGGGLFLMNGANVL